MRPFAASLALALACAHAPVPQPEPPVERDEPDAVCLRWLEEHHLAFEPVELDDVRTPIEVRGPLGGIQLVPRAGRPPRMDCSLAQALAEAGPIFDELGIRTLSFSGAYDRRMRRNSPRLSEHAHGLAIDVHVLGTAAGDLDIARDFEAGAGAWRHLTPGEGALEACIGTPRTEKGRALRTLVCRLKLHSAFRVIATPDDDADHRDHLHLETFPDTLARVRRIVGVLPLRGPN
jgi:hypothetical protein